MTTELFAGLILDDMPVDMPCGSPLPRQRLENTTTSNRNNNNTDENYYETAIDDDNEIPLTQRKSDSGNDIVICYLSCGRERSCVL